VKNFVMSEASDLNYFGDVLKVVEQKGTNLVEVAKGDRLMAGEVVLDVLSPDRVYENENNNSILCKLSYKEFSMLLTGDIEKEVEELMVEDGVELDCDVLKVAHHGSDTSSSEEFIDEVSPEVAIVSVGENNYGHPAGEVLDRFERVYRTDESGAVTLRTDGEEVSVEEFGR